MILDRIANWETMSVGQIVAVANTRNIPNSERQTYSGIITRYGTDFGLTLRETLKGIINNPNIPSNIRAAIDFAHTKLDNDVGLDFNYTELRNQIVQIGQFLEGFPTQMILNLGMDSLAYQFYKRDVTNEDIQTLIDEFELSEKRRNYLAEKESVWANFRQQVLEEWDGQESTKPQLG